MKTISVNSTNSASIFLHALTLTLTMILAITALGCGQESSKVAGEKEEARKKAVEVPAVASPGVPAPTAAPAVAPTVASRGTTPQTTPKASYETARLEYVRQNGVPPEFKGLKNPLTPDKEVLEKGKKLFGVKCALCHGKEGRGDAPAGRALKPPAANLALLAAQSEADDGYLFWCITRGGRALRSAMPVFKSLPEEDRWAIILHIKETLKEE